MKVINNSNDISELCITTFVFGSYQKFIPYYIYSISKTYPNSFVKIFIEDELKSNIQSALNVIKNNGFSAFEIVKTEFDNLIFEKNKIKGGGSKTLFRWLFYYEYFKEFKYLYYGDVDILILSEEINLLELHKQKMKEFDLPFSNRVRKDESGKLVNRLTGLHFVETEPYFAKIDTVINKILNDENYREKIMLNVIRDENLLYEMNNSVFNINDELLSNFDTPLHGLHLGIARNYAPLDDELLKESSSIEVTKLKEQLKKIYVDEQFIQIQKLIFVNELYHLNRFLGLSNPFIWKYNWIKDLIFGNLLQIKKSIKKRLKQ